MNEKGAEIAFLEKELEKLTVTPEQHQVVEERLTNALENQRMKLGKKKEKKNKKKFNMEVVKQQRDARELEESKKEIEELRRKHAIELEEARQMHEMRVEEARQKYEMRVEEVRQKNEMRAEEVRQKNEMRVEEVRQMHEMRAEEARQMHEIESNMLRKALEEKDIRTARFSFLVQATKETTFEGLRSLAMSCQFPDVDDRIISSVYFGGTSFGSDYTNSSSSGSVLEGDIPLIKMSSFRLRNIPDTDKFLVRVFTPSKETLQWHIQNVVFQNCSTSYVSYMDSVKSDLRLLRNVFWGISRDTGIDKIPESNVQCIFQNFLQEIIDRLQDGPHKSYNAKVISVNHQELRFTLSDMCTVKGFSDVATCAVGEENDGSWQTIFELKSPLGILTGNGANMAQKDQLLAELAGLAERNSSVDSANTICGGALTDIFSLHIALRVTEANGSAIYFISNKVVDPEAYILYMLFLFCRPNVNSELTELMRVWLHELVDCKSERDDKFVKPVVQRGPGAKRTHGDGKKSNSGAKSTQPSSTNKVTSTTKENFANFQDPECTEFSDDSDLESEKYESLRVIRQWEARRQGIVYLDREALQALGTRPAAI